MVENKELYEYLTRFLSEKRVNRYRNIIDNRTRHICIVLEEIYQTHNASAVIRSAECMGIQDIHIIENEFRYEVNPDVVVGSNKWINIYTYNRLADNTASTIKSLRDKGYRIVGTSPHGNPTSLNELDISQKTALLFGNEKLGLTDLALGLCDEIVAIPMYGFTESFNISVSAAICLYDLILRLHKSDVQWQLSEEEKYELLVRWAKTSLNQPEIIEEAYRKLKI